MKRILFLLGGYLACLLWGIGMLKAAQETRRLLYGGQPVMAAVHSGRTVTLGGGEWTFTLPETAISRSEMLPPCTLRLILRFYEAAAHTAEVIG